MRKLLNTLYVTKEDGYLSLDGENLVLSIDGKEAIRLPFSNIESIVCINYPGCSPALMGKCAEEQVGLCFVSPHGRFLARVTGPIKGNVLLRREQVRIFEDDGIRLSIVRAILTAKLKNTRNLMLRSRRDNPETDEDGFISHTLNMLQRNIENINVETDFEVLRGIEGHSAKTYFNVFNRLITKQKEDFTMLDRSKRPPLDRVNAILSFLYTVCTNDIASALECVGLDPYIGVFHTLRPGRVSLACDMMEEFRAMIERLTISLINLKTIQADDFDVQISGAVLLNDSGRKKVITAWQNKKKEIILHPFLREKVAIGLFPYVQATLMAKYIRGENQEYYPFIWG
ncbi:MAG: type I-C CRISPR-associated endonuclease Cas1 [Ruminococcaceae bacterium]|nr:type I-C CRISPR-associated endonuclease Cas1 [Oscillospiraceae bacterium]